MAVGLDTNILCYSLDPAYPEHKKLGGLLLGLSQDNIVSINPTILHETYHTLVFGQKWLPSEAVRRLLMLLQHPYIDFHNQTRRTCLVALNLAVKYGLGGRDALIIANFIINNISVMYTHDRDLLSLREVAWRKNAITFEDPLAPT